jgi:hypothetical protein
LVVSKVKGVLFADYVRMLRMRKDVDWSQHLDDADRSYLEGRVALDGWYPMSVFERLGNAILKELAQGQLGLVRLWGRSTVDQLVNDQPFLLADGDPVETVNRFRGLRATWFDFEALTVPVLLEDECEISIQYGMGATAEEAATWQAVGFFERLLEKAGAEEVKPTFLAQSWKGQGDRTRVRLQWKSRF